MDLVGVEPITFYCFGPSKKPRQRDFLLLTLTKLGVGSRNLTYLNLVCNQAHKTLCHTDIYLVRGTGFEPATFELATRCSTKLS
jgi:hypothetical protein